MYRHQFGNSFSAARMIVNRCEIESNSYSPSKDAIRLGAASLSVIAMTGSIDFWSSNRLDTVDISSFSSTSETAGASESMTYIL